MRQESPELLIDEATIRSRVQELARRISNDYAGVDDLLLVGVLRGAFIFLADLSRCLTVPRTVDFIAVSSYDASRKVEHAVRLVLDLRSSVAGRHVLLVEDIVDTGDTLDYLTKMLSVREVASVRTCVLVRKRTQRQLQVPIDYLGFEIPDVWVVGYGLDYADRYRTLPYIGVIQPEDEPDAAG